MSDTTQAASETAATDEAANAMFGGAASFASAESIEILNLLGDNAGGDSCCGGGCCSSE